MHDENIIMTKEERAMMLEREEVLQKVKALLLIPRLFMATTQQVADFFEIDVEAVQKCYQRNKEELDDKPIPGLRIVLKNGILMCEYLGGFLF